MIRETLQATDMTSQYHDTLADVRYARWDSIDSPIPQFRTTFLHSLVKPVSADFRTKRTGWPGMRYQQPAELFPCMKSLSPGIRQAVSQADLNHDL